MGTSDVPMRFECQDMTFAELDGVPRTTPRTTPYVILATVGASIGLGLCLGVATDIGRIVTSNQVPASYGRIAPLSMLIGSILLPLAAVSISRRAGPDLRAERFASLARLCSPMIVAAFLPPLFDPFMYRDQPVVSCFVVLSCALILARTYPGAREAAVQLFSNVSYVVSMQAFLAIESRRRLALRAFAPAGVVVLGALMVGSHHARYSIQDHANLQTWAWDLGIFDNLMWNLVHGHGFASTVELGRVGSHLQIHANFIALAFVPFYWMWPRPETLLILQAYIVPLGAFPLYLITHRWSGSRWTALCLAAAFLLYAPQHGPVFYDFHFLTLSPTFVLLFVALYEMDRMRSAIVVFALTLLIREDVALGLCFVTLFLALTGRRSRIAMVLTAVAAAYFVLVKFQYMPSVVPRVGNQGVRFSELYRGLIPQGGEGFSAILTTLVTNPVFVLTTLFERAKLQYVLSLLIPLLGLPLRRAETLVLLVPGFLITLLTTHDPAAVEIGFQYTAHWTPYVFLGAAWVLSRPSSPPGVLLAMMAASIWMSYGQGALLQHQTFVGGNTRVLFSHTPEQHRDLVSLRQVIAQIPPDASVAAGENAAPHVSARHMCFSLGRGYNDADYLLENVKNVKAGWTHDQLLRAINTGKYGMVDLRGPFMLWKRGAPHARNEEGLAFVDPDRPKPASDSTAP